MRTRTWLRPTIAIVAALAVGSTAAIVGASLAAPARPVAAPIETESVPVLAPIGSGEEAPPIDLDGDPDTIDSSPAVGRFDVPVEHDDELDPRIRDILDTMSEAEDPGPVADPLTVYPEDETGGSGGDECAPRDGEAPDGCPDGLSSTILPLTAPPTPYVIAAADPSTYEDSLYKTVYCEPQEHGELDLPLGAGTNVPATIRVTWHPQGRPAESRTVELETTAADRAAWEAASDWAERESRPQHCTVLRDLEPDTVYEMRLDAVDIFDREFRFDLRVNLPDDRTVPPTRIVPLGPNIVFASAPHTASRGVEIRAWVIGDGDEEDCGGSFPPNSDLGALSEQATTDVSAEYLERRNYQPAYTKRTAASFWVPEGSTILVCIRWLDSSGPSWQWGTASAYTQTVLESPDYIVPKVSIESIDSPLNFDENSVRIGARTREGFGCGFWDGPATAGPIDESAFDSGYLCQSTFRDSFTSGSRGDIVVSSTIFQGDNHTTASSMLALSRRGCVGVCELPEPTFYHLSLATVERGDGLCGSSFGACDPPTSAQSAGTMQLRVEWEQGNTNGRSEWFVSDPIHGTRDDALAGLPQMDVGQDVAVTKVPAIEAYDARFTLATDRAVDWSARLVGPCYRDDTTREFEGTSTGSVSVGFSKLCAGTEYFIEVLLTDDTGAESFWSVNAAETRWVRGVFSTPPSVIDVSVSYTVASTELYRLSKLSPFTVTVGGHPVVNLSGEEGCIDGPSTFATGRITNGIAVGDLVPIRIFLNMFEAGGRTGSDPLCNEWADNDIPPLVLSTTVRRADLAHGVTITSPEGSAYDVSVTIIED